ncbi:MAG: type II toxin-antitoxin system VapC family toxin [Acidimicrobiia bacterium]|nr:type II toxin-antitoxin system VapC family toxin [Acidimicrobiia bacterium]
MRLLLDTHVFLWANAQPGRLGTARPLLEDERNELLVSAASSWEIAIKFGLGRLPLPEPPARWVPSRLRALGATALPVEHAHALAVGELPALHRDPFDRLLVAQATMLGIPIVTGDETIARYEVEVIHVG